MEITRVRYVLYEFKEGFLPSQFIMDAMEEVHGVSGFLFIPVR